MVKKVKERGPVDFGACRADPSLCADLISEEDRGSSTPWEKWKNNEERDVQERRRRPIPMFVRPVGRAVML